MSQKTFSELDEQTMHIKGVIEALLFVNERPITLEQIRKVLQTVAPSEIKKVIQILQVNFGTQGNYMLTGKRKTQLRDSLNYARFRFRLT